MVTPTGEMFLYGEVSTETTNKAWNGWQMVDVTHIEKTLEADRYLCTQFRQVLADALAVTPEGVLNAIDTLGLELLENPENVPFKETIYRLLGHVKDIDTVARGGIVERQDIHKSATITIGSLCELLKGVQFGEMEAKMQELRSSLEDVMQGQPVQDHFRGLTAKKIEADMHGMNPDSNSNSVSAKRIDRANAAKRKGKQRR